jgi:hypothetical protein
MGDPIFERIDCEGHIEVNCWYETEGKVYYNRQLTPYKQLPFVVLDPSQWELMIKEQ